MGGVIKRKKGFTVIEMIVVVFIISILAAMAAGFYRNGQENYKLVRAAYKLESDIRKIQEYAMSAKPDSNCANPNFHPNYISAYGIYFDKNNPDQYILFSDCNGNGIYNASDDKKLGGAEIFYESGIINTLADDATIIFTPPDPVVSFYPDQPYGTYIILKSNKTGNLRGVLVNRRGAIWVYTPMSPTPEPQPSSSP